MAYDNDQGTDTGDAIAAGMALAEPHVVIANHLLTAMVPEGAKLERIDIEQYQDRPSRKRGIFQFDDAASFIEFVNREKLAESYILGSRGSDGSNSSFTAVFNADEPASETRTVPPAMEGGPEVTFAARPGWSDHRAVYNCPFSDEWRRWSGSNGKQMNQTDFAIFIEENLLDIIVPDKQSEYDALVGYTVYPSANEMLLASRGLAAKTDVTFASAIRLDNGQVQFKYEEEISGTVQGNSMQVPTRFAIGVPVYRGTAAWQLYAKLRWRVAKGGLTMWYELERVQKVLEKAFDEARTQIAQGTGLPTFLGRRT